MTNKEKRGVKKKIVNTPLKLLKEPQLFKKLEKPNQSFTETRGITSASEDVVWRPKGLDSGRPSPKLSSPQREDVSALPVSLHLQRWGRRDGGGTTAPVVSHSLLLPRTCRHRPNTPTLLTQFPNETVEIRNFTDSQPPSPRVLNVWGVKQARRELKVGCQGATTVCGEAPETVPVPSSTSHSSHWKPFLLGRMANTSLVVQTQIPD